MPEDIKTAVFTKGIEKGSKIKIPKGGHQTSSAEGAILV
jgi:hypothetical protein